MAVRVHSEYLILVLGVSCWPGTGSCCGNSAVPRQAKKARVQAKYNVNVNVNVGRTGGLGLGGAGEQGGIEGLMGHNSHL